MTVDVLVQRDGVHAETTAPDLAWLTIRIKPRVHTSTNTPRCWPVLCRKLREIVAADQFKTVLKLVLIKIYVSLLSCGNFMAFLIVQK